MRRAVVSLEVIAEDGFKLHGSSSISLISRDSLELVRQILSYHDYPDGFALFLGTMFAPSHDRGTPGRGFTHKLGDVVRVSSGKLGTLTNKVTTCDRVPS